MIIIHNYAMTKQIIWPPFNFHFFRMTHTYAIYSVSHIPTNDDMIISDFNLRLHLFFFKFRRRETISCIYRRNIN